MSDAESRAWDIKQERGHEINQARIREGGWYNECKYCGDLFDSDREFKEHLSEAHTPEEKKQYDDDGTD